MFIKKYPLMNDEPGEAGGGLPADGGTPPAEPPADSGTPPTNYFADVPEDWRNQLAGEDEKRLGQLERMTSFDKFTESYWNAQEKIRKGELSSGLPENPTDEQLATWREANDVPASAEEYKLQLEDGLVLGEADEAVLKDVMDVFHAGNVPNSVVSAATSAFLKARDVEVQSIQAQDAQHKIDTESALKATWSNDYQGNVNAVKGMVAKMPESIREGITSARLPDGRALFNSPEFLVWAADTARTLDPHGTVVPDAANPLQAIDEEIKSLEAKMGTDEWYKDTAAQQRYQQLIEAKGRM